MKQRFKISSYQVVLADNQRDTVQLLVPVLTEDLEAYRAGLKDTHPGCRYINLNYMTLNTEEED